MFKSTSNSEGGDVMSAMQKPRKSPRKLSPTTLSPTEHAHSDAITSDSVSEKKKKRNSFSLTDGALAVTGEMLRQDIEKALHDEEHKDELEKEKHEKELAKQQHLELQKQEREKYKQEKEAKRLQIEQHNREREEFNKQQQELRIQQEAEEKEKLKQEEETHAIEYKEQKRHEMEEKFAKENELAHLEAQKMIDEKREKMRKDEEENERLEKERKEALEARMKQLLEEAGELGADVVVPKKETVTAPVIQVEEPKVVEKPKPVETVITVEPVVEQVPVETPAVEQIVEPLPTTIVAPVESNSAIEEPVIVAPVEEPVVVAPVEVVEEPVVVAPVQVVPEPTSESTEPVVEKPEPVVEVTVTSPTIGIEIEEAEDPIIALLDSLETNDISVSKIVLPKANDEDVTDICRALKNNTRVIMLDLTNAKSVTDKSVGAICLALETSTSLKKLYLEGTSITKFAGILFSLERNYKIVDMTLPESAEDEDLDHLDEILDRNENQ